MRLMIPQKGDAGVSHADRPRRRSMPLKIVDDGSPRVMHNLVTFI
jgi:hypothetical protein